MRRYETTVCGPEQRSMLSVWRLEARICPTFVFSSQAPQPCSDLCEYVPVGDAVRRIQAILERGRGKGYQRGREAKEEGPFSVWIYVEGSLSRKEEILNCALEQRRLWGVWHLENRPRKFKNAQRNGRRGLIDADPLSPLLHGSRYCSIGSDLLDLAYTRVQFDPRPQIEGKNHRSCRVSADLDLTGPDQEVCLQPEQVKSNCFQILIKPPEGNLV